VTIKKAVMQLLKSYPQKYDRTLGRYYIEVSLKKLTSDVESLCKRWVTDGTVSRTLRELRQKSVIYYRVAGKGVYHVYLIDEWDVWLKLMCK